ncbi:hypothetical protein [Cohaesibacter celericrescens]|uniref:Fructose-bisphosphate aldolase n=1 Tax=Cohaesibacter celericrescens TaxID=2067669 RepID=A0A2N5XPR1_9HYPH|nr:hypothetical protein [Cohaesibacter celericrescens]PLW76465.1 hypothetical protein C0081_14435 [Cohaesibacter celericrescens]
MSSPKRLDQKLARIEKGDYTPSDFIIADAKDADMAGGIAANGPRLDASGQPTSMMRPMQVYRDDMVAMIQSDLVDIMLTSLSSAEYLSSAGHFAGSDITPTVRLNDGSDIWLMRGADYKRLPCQPFRTARLDRVRPVADLGLYAITFYNDLEKDYRTLEAYAQFRDEANAAGIRHFLEVFNPHFDVATPGTDFASYNNDAIVRTLAGVSRLDGPIFLKMAYNGPHATEELASYDPSRLIVGILGGAFSTTRDTLEMVKQAERYGARVALFGRRIFFAESSTGIVRTMRRMLEEDISSEESCKTYYDELLKAGIKPKLSLAEDLELTDPVLKAGF